MKDLFCVRCATTTPHSGYLDQNGEYVFTCSTTGCGNFVKFPQVQEAAELESLIASHEETNKPIAEAMSATREQQSILSEVLGDGTAVEVSAKEEPATEEVAE